MIWIILYFGSMLVYPPLVFGVLILHLCSMGEKRRSRKRQQDIALGVEKALNSRDKKNAKSAKTPYIGFEVE